MDDYLEDLQKLKISRYQQVIIASKYARLINARLTQQRLKEESSEESEKKEEPQLYRRVAMQALKALLDGKIEYEEPQREGRS